MRGSRFDLFSYSKDRRLDLQLIDQYEHDLRLIKHLDLKKYKIENPIKRKTASALTIVASETNPNDIKIIFLFKLKNKANELEINKRYNGSVIPVSEY